ncbi:hypothetical protein CpB1069 [Chlamydia pneumoniae TW-183]|uniref:Transmembrane protein n=3 Tax=Chlamydia pneumoniae TaxID=83558 RepID=A0A0H2UMN9_CHLPN|nr:hypothetical protein CPn_1029 [Chlamydia pneumoniae CWL029]AAP98997.1 hypothetical protein CpB1069 [Chlamydia pneumoniae TW-183]BAA99236.1 hypothetical protein [Chlamydia pneumoniae J138]
MLWGVSMRQSFDELSQNAFKNIFNKQRFCFIFCSLCCFGFVFALFLKLCSRLAPEISLSTLGLGAFFCAFSVICASAIIVQFLLHKESQGETSKLCCAIKNTWSSLWLSLLVSMPFFIAMVAVVTVAMLSSFLGSLPWVGKLFHTVLIFIPYLSATALILLFLGSFSCLFFCIPVLHNQESIDYRKLLECFRGNILRQFIGVVIALVPLALCSWLALDSFYLMTHLVEIADIHTWSFLAQMFVLIVPIALILTPAVSFFFNFSFSFYLAKQEEEKALVK